VLMTRGLGFTLLEILVVLFIISILSGLVLVNLPNPSGQTETLAAVHRLHLVMNRAFQAAEQESVEYGVLLDRRGYQILVFDPISLTWKDSSNPEHAYEAFPDGFRPLLSMETEQANLGSSEEREESEGDDETSPQILLLSSGETTIFELIFEDESGARLRISGSGFGETTISDLAEAI